MTIGIDTLVTQTTRLLNDYHSILVTYFDMFYNTTPMDITVSIYDMQGVLQTYTIPNRAKDFQSKLTGQGTPENVVTGSMGYIYQDLTNGDLYIKSTNALNTGWLKLITGNIDLDSCIRTWQLDTDNTLGGVNSSDSMVPSQKAVKDYISNHMSPVPRNYIDGLIMSVNTSDAYSGDLTSTANAISNGCYTTQYDTKAFDNDLNTYWESAQNHTDQNGTSYIGQENLVQTIAKIDIINTLYVHSPAIYQLTSVKIQYSNDGLNWIDIQTVSLDTDTGVTNTIILDSYTPASVHSLRILANSNITIPPGHSSSGWLIGEIKMYALQNPSYQVSVSGGICADSTNNTAMELVPTIVDLTVSGVNGLDTGVEAVNSWYNVFVIAKADGTTNGLLAKQNPAHTYITPPILPTDYIYYRRIGSIFNDVSGNIKPFIQNGNSFNWYQHINDIIDLSLNTTAKLYTMSVPLGLSVIALTQYQNYASNGGAILISSPLQSDQVPVLNTMAQMSTATTYQNNYAGHILTNTSGQIRARGSVNSCNLYAVTSGYIDSRGKN